MSEPIILLEIADRVATVTLNDPERLNPVTGNEMIAGLLDARDRAGGDIKEIVDPESVFRRDPLAAAEGYVKGIQRIPLALCMLNIPMIAAVNGPAVGGGCDLMMYDVPDQGTPRSPCRILRQTKTVVF